MRRFLLPIQSVFAGLLLAACSPLAWAQGSTAAVPPVARITQPINNNVVVSLPSSVPPITARAQDLGAASDSLPVNRTILMLQRSETQETALKKRLHDQQDPKSPSYHRWLTPTQFGEQFGASPADIAAISNWLAGFGLQVEPVMAGRSEIVFSGTSGQLRNAFHVQLHGYTLEGKSYWANTNPPEIPAALAPVVRGFSSLNNFPKRALHSTPKIVKKTEAGWAAAVAGSQSEFTTTQNGSTFLAIGPSDLATIYNIHPLWNAGIDGTGQTIAIVADSNINPADVDSFRSTFGLPAKKLNILYYGPNPGYGADETEAVLDVEWAGAVAKNATIDLVAAQDTPTSGGIDGAAIYVINNNLASILNVSYGTCEPALGTDGNQFYSEIWEQAAAQGITVFVAAGDSGSAVCDQNQQVAQYGLTVNGIASTPYNIAVGGTDLYGNYPNAGRYWSRTNDPTTLASALSYIPELPWNNSCASPQLLSALEGQGYAGTTNEALCNDFSEFSFINTVGGSGGASGCFVLDSSGNCQGGYPKPDWQAGVPGIPADGVRDVPDVSLMAGNGLWGSFYVFCQSDSTPTGQCDVNTAVEGAGGTSFASPIYAGIMALIQQKTNSSQGNANYVLYKLAAAQYSQAGNAANCNASNPGNESVCIFHDVTDGTNAVPCLAGSRNCTASPGDSYGVLPGYNSGSGFDLTTGLGSVNVANLVTGWSSSSATYLPATVSLSAAGATTVAYGTSIQLKVAVTASQAGLSLPSGDVGVISNSASSNSDSITAGTLSNGSASLVAQGLAIGSYQLFARYAGDAIYAPADSGGLPIVVTRVAPAVALTASRQTVEVTQTVTLSTAVKGVVGGAYPTGTVTFTDTSNGVSLGTVAVTPDASYGTVLASAFVAVTRSQLQRGANSIVAIYSGDTNYAPSTTAATTLTSIDPFTMVVNPTALTLSPQGTGSVTVTITPNGSAVLSPANLALSCPSGLASGLGCSFSAPTISGGNVISTLTLTAASPLDRSGTITASISPSSGWKPGSTLIGLGFLFTLGCFRRRKRLPALLLLVIAAMLPAVGCGGSNNSQASKPQVTATATTLSINPSAPTYNTPVVLTANVAPMAGSGVPTGSITFSAGSSVLGTASLASGAATLHANALAVGPQSLTATYSGDTNYVGSTSSPSNVDVKFTTMIVVAATDKANNTSNASLAVTIQ